MKIQNKQVLSQIQENLVVPITDLSSLTKGIGHEGLQTTVSDLLRHINDPFLFVIVGEVKAGKSSFINALLQTDQEICKVAPSPMTDTIQQIVYGEKHSEVAINPYLKRITFPEEVLKDIAIVDTPGTNTIIAHHQEITENFIPQADLIVFVFEAKNPYRQSAWEFFDYINDEWKKKIIFILQQKDLMPQDDLDINLDGVRKHAIDKGILEPNVFAVSAKMHIEHQENSGYDILNEYIENNITGGQAPFLKLQSNARTAQSINDKIGQSLTIRNDQWQIDQKFRNDILETLDQQERKTSKQIDFLVENLIAAYDRITKKKGDQLKQGLAFIPMLRRSFGTLMGGKEGPKEWLENLTRDFEQQLNISLRDKLQDGVIDIADNIQTMAKLVDSKLKTSETILKNSDEIFADIAEKRTSILKDLQQSFAQFMNKSENFYDQSMIKDSENMAPNLAAGGGMAVIGIILATVVNGAVFDITGGILTTIGLLFAGVSIGFKRRKIIRAFDREILNGRTQLEEEVSLKLKDYTKRIKQRIDNNFSQFDDYLNEESKVIKSLSSSKDAIEQSLDNILKDIDQHLNR